MKPVKKPKRTATAVSDWDWQPHPESGRYYRYYIDEQGQRQVQWTEPQTPRTEGVDDTSYVDPSGEADFSNEESAYTLNPVQDAAVGYTEDVTGAAGGWTEEPIEADLATGVGSLTVEDDEEEEGHHNRDSHATTGSSSKGKSNERKTSKREEKKSSSSKAKKDSKGTSSDKKAKGKGKEKETRHHDEPPDPFYAPDQHHQAQHHHQSQPQQHRAHRQKRAQGHGHGHQAAPIGVTGGATPGDTQPVDPGYGARSASSIDAEAPYYPTSEQPIGGAHGAEQDPQDQMEVFDEPSDIGDPAAAGYPSGYSPQELDDNDEDYQRAVEQSRQAAFAGSTGYEAYPPGYGQGETSYSQHADYEPVQEEEDDGSVTPTRDNPGLETDSVIRGTQGSYEAIDARYRVESSNKFQPGEVFKILWSEPQGQSRDKFPNRLDIETYTDRMQLENDWGERFYVGFRRFIVVANDEGHCTCVPILTYIRQGCKKRGVKPAKHGIVHEYGTKPRPLEGEPKLGFRAVRMQIQATGERLARESRVNYSKLVTVEHNVKVFFIGNIYPQDFDDIVPAAVDRCWQEKIRKRVKKGLGKDPRN